VTIAIDSMTFKQPVHVGQLMVCKARVTYVGRHAIEVQVLVHAENVLSWLTPGGQFGLAAGIALAAALLALPRLARLALAAVLLMAATVLVNLAPPNPYLAATLKVWEQGHFLNFNGLTRLVGSLWPFAALGYLIYLASAASRQAVR